MVDSGRRIVMNFARASSWPIHRVPFTKLAYMSSDCFELDRRLLFGFIFSYI